MNILAHIASLLLLALVSTQVLGAPAVDEDCADRKHRCPLLKHSRLQRTFLLQPMISFSAATVGPNPGFERRVSTVDITIVLL